MIVYVYDDKTRGDDEMTPLWVFNANKLPQVGDVLPFPNNLIVRSVSTTNNLVICYVYCPPVKRSLWSRIIRKKQR